MKQLALLCGVLFLLLALLTACQAILAEDPSLPAQPVQATPPADPAFFVEIDLDQDTIIYRVVERMRVVNEGQGQPSKHNLWIALIGDVEPYQEVLDQQISPANYQVVEDEYGNRYAEFDLADMAPGTEVPISITTRVAVHRISPDLSVCEGEVPTFFTQPELHVESNNPQIVALAEELSAGQEDACGQQRAFYDYVASNLVYTYNGQDWGAQAALGEMGTDCTEFASLLMALSRAAGIPARYLEGLTYLPPSEGEALARTEHSWLEVYLPGVGWTPMDPTMGRAIRTRTSYFANMPPNHIIVTRGRNPSTLRGGNYWTHLYWPGNSTRIRIKDFSWDIRPEVE